MKCRHWNSGEFWWWAFDLLQFTIRGSLQRSKLWKVLGIQHCLPAKKQIHRLGIISDLALIIIPLPVFSSALPSESEILAFKKM